jgi:hypothetical protein
MNLNLFLAQARLICMGPERDMSAIEAKLARCRELQHQTDCEFTRAHLRQLAAELQAQLRRLDDQQRRLGHGV